MGMVTEGAGKFKFFPMNSEVQKSVLSNFSIAKLFEVVAKHSSSKKRHIFKALVKNQNFQKAYFCEKIIKIAKRLGVTPLDLRSSRPCLRYAWIAPVCSARHLTETFKKYFNFWFKPFLGEIVVARLYVNTFSS